MDVAIVILLVILLSAQGYAISLHHKKEPARETILIKDGNIQTNALSSAGLTLGDLTVLARKKGYFNLGDIDTAILEKDGSLSVLVKPQRRALNPRDFNFSPVREGVPIAVAQDGKIVKENLPLAGVTEEEVLTVLETRGRTLSDILLATITESGRIDVFETSKEKGFTQNG